MPYRDLEPFSKQLTIVVGLTVVGFMAFGLALSFYRNVLFEASLQNLSVRNRTLREKIGLGYRDLEYYRSNQYKDKYAKESLGKLNPGEKILMITGRPGGSEEAADAASDLTLRRRAAFEELLRHTPVIEHWKMYLFREEDLEMLKRSL